MRGVVTDTGAITATVYIGGYYEQIGTTRRSYYYLGGKRVAMRDQADDLWFLLGDHLGSTSVAYRDDGSETSFQRYYAWGAVRPGPENALPTDYTYTGGCIPESSVQIAPIAEVADIVWRSPACKLRGMLEPPPKRRHERLWRAA